MAVLGNSLCRIPGIIHDDFLGENYDLHSVAKSGDIKLALVVQKLQEIKGSQIAGRVIEKHILAAGVRGIDPSTMRAGVPAIYRRVKLHPWIARDMSSLCNQAEYLPGLICLHHFSSGNGPNLPRPIIQNGLHKLVRNPNTVIGVLKEHRSISLTIERTVVPCVDQSPYLFFLIFFAINELNDIGMIDIEDYHLGSSSSLTSRFDDTSKGIVAFHEGYRTRCGSPTRKMFL